MISFLGGWRLAPSFLFVQPFFGGGLVLWVLFLEQNDHLTSQVFLDVSVSSPSSMDFSSWILSWFHQGHHCITGICSFARRICSFARLRLLWRWYDDVMMWWYDISIFINIFSIWWRWYDEDVSSCGKCLEEFSVKRVEDDKITGASSTRAAFPGLATTTSKFATILHDHWTLGPYSPAKQSEQSKKSQSKQLRYRLATAGTFLLHQVYLKTKKHHFANAFG